MVFHESRPRQELQGNARDCRNVKSEVGNLLDSAKLPGSIEIKEQAEHEICGCFSLSRMPDSLDGKILLEAPGPTTRNETTQEGQVERDQEPV